MPQHTLLYAPAPQRGKNKSKRDKCDLLLYKALETSKDSVSLCMRILITQITQRQLGLTHRPGIHELRCHWGQAGTIKIM